eukprot:scaffold228999_cov18-Tisochrysis_lutea.AAC.2
MAMAVVGGWLVLGGAPAAAASWASTAASARARGKHACQGVVGGACACPCGRTRTKRASMGCLGVVGGVYICPCGQARMDRARMEVLTQR